MLTSAVVHIPETLTGLIGGALIGLSFWWSLRHNKREAEGVKEAPTPG